MTIKHLGGIFGRNPTFNDAEVDGDLTVTGESTFYDNIYVRNDTAPTISIFDSNGGFSAATLTSQNGGRDLAIFAPQDLIFNQDGLETARFRDGGGLCFNGDTAAANALDDYEEGTWTPATDTGTVNSSGYYTKIGNIVTATGLISTFSDRSSTSNVSVSGLPFASTLFQAAGSAAGRYVALAASTSLITSSNRLNFYTMSSGNYAVLAHDDLSSSSSAIYFQITYQTSA